MSIGLTEALQVYLKNIFKSRLLDKVSGVKNLVTFLNIYSEIVLCGKCKTPPDNFSLASSSKLLLLCTLF